MASRLLQGSHKLKKMTMKSQFVNIASSSIFFFVFLFFCLFDVAVFSLASLVTDLSIISISLPILELWQFLLIKDWTEIRKLEIPLSEFYQISGGWQKSGIPNLVRLFLIKGYWMLRITIVIAVAISELLKENQ